LWRSLLLALRPITRNRHFGKKLWRRPCRPTIPAEVSARHIYVARKPSFLGQLLLARELGFPPHIGGGAATRQTNLLLSPSNIVADGATLSPSPKASRQHVAVATGQIGQTGLWRRRYSLAARPKGPITKLWRPDCKPPHTNQSSGTTLWRLYIGRWRGQSANIKAATVTDTECRPWFRGGIRSIGPLCGPNTAALCRRNHGPTLSLRVVLK